MTLSLYAATIPSKLQILRAARGWLDKAEASDFSEEEILNARLAEDMLPFSYQIKSMANHSKDAIEGVRAGVFTPKFKEALPASLAELRSLLEGAISYLEALSEADMSGFVGQDMRFEIGEKKLPFTAEDFLLTFSQPNFYFHATTAYAILRNQGLPVGKLDFLGALRLKQA